MTRLCVSIFVHDIAQARADADAARQSGAEMVEFRVDELTAAPAVCQLLADLALPAVITCRPEGEGGHSRLDDARRFKLLADAISPGVTHVDAELRAIEAGTPQPITRAGERRADLIVSSHDFNGRPESLEGLVQRLEGGGADVVKIVWTAQSILDNLEAFEILGRAKRPTIVLCMGEAGQISRVLAKKFGAFLSFAAIDKGKGTAPGQISVGDMKKLYRWDALGPRTRVYGVVARPVAHSLSPAIQNAAFAHVGYDAVYLPFLVGADYEAFAEFMCRFVAFDALDLCGLSVTIPHKENALKYLRETGGEIEELARRIGAVNTILIQGSGSSKRLIGRNTDYAAILDSIIAKLGIGLDDLAQLRVAVIGAGGTGRTATAALAQYGATVVVYNRTRDRADALAEEFNQRSGKVVAAPLEKLCDSCCHVFINCTSVGMYPNVEASPLGERPPEFTDQTLVFDTIYNPARTRFLRQAEAAGAKTIGGMEMFVRQAAAQFTMWTGKEAPVDVMRRAMEERVGR